MEKFVVCETQIQLKHDAEIKVQGGSYCLSSIPLYRRYLPSRTLETPTPSLQVGHTPVSLYNSHSVAFYISGGWCTHLYIFELTIDS